jgi:hypothetical protein
MTDKKSSDDEKPDMRRTEHTDFGVRVQRDLTESSDFLAHGNRRHFSKIRFTLEPDKLVNAESGDQATGNTDTGSTEPAANEVSDGTLEESAAPAKPNLFRIGR